uniref:Uncharacterized protein n=1 Tax=Picea glauca TaxID=3330 RepID=A0A101LZF0_PICGL|nr:hypothetical protein ABT39_MTgene5156 [Picea glauca]
MYVRMAVLLPREFTTALRGEGSSITLRLVSIIHFSATSAPPHLASDNSAFPLHHVPSLIPSCIYPSGVMYVFRPQLHPLL